jgi:serine/alanine adding enzyme
MKNEIIMSFFQSPVYFELMEGVPGVKPFVQTAREPDGVINGQYMGVYLQTGNVLTKRLTARILLIDEPLVQSKEIENTTALLYEGLTNIDKKFKACIYTEIRFLKHKPIHFDFSRIPHCQYSPYLNIIVDTTRTEQQLFNQLSESKRRQVRISRSNGAIVRCAENEEEVKTFYSILHNLYRTKVKKPLYPLEFFLRFFNRKEAGVILLAIYNDKIIGGMLCPIFENKEMYEWYIAGMDSEQQKNKIYPSVLLTWEALCYATSHKINRFNFMGAGKPGVSYGVRNFKSKFGGELVETPRYVIAHKPLMYTTGKFFMNLGLGTFLTNE